jgi:hypothetical protein
VLLSFPGINVVSAADFAGELGPIEHYANPNAITGRAGLRPCRYQSDQVDRADGPLVRNCNHAGGTSCRWCASRESLALSRITNA